MNYLYYDTKTKAAEGLLDRRACLLILLAEAKLSNRVAVIPKFNLRSGHNNGKALCSYLIDDYVSLENIEAAYILDEDFEQVKTEISEDSILHINDERFDFDLKNPLIIRHLKSDNFWNLNKLYEVNSLARLYQGFGTKFVIPKAAAPKRIKEIADRILSRLERPVIGLHLRRGDRLNKKLNASMQPDVLLPKLNDFKYQSVYYCSNDKSYKINDPGFFSHKDFQDELGAITDNYLLFSIEMYIVDNADISVRTFKDSSPVYFKDNTENTNYSICNYSMHGSHNSYKSVPKKLCKIPYDLDRSISKKPFTPRLAQLPRILNGVARRLKKLVATFLF
ncbi:MAG: hypothetical protein ACWA5P_05330 [bacterium]